MPLVLPVFMLYMNVVLYAHQLSGYLASQLRVILKKQDYQHARERMAGMGKILFYLILPVCAFLLAQANVVSTAYDGSNDGSIMSKEQVIEYFLSGLEYTTSVDGIVFSTDEFNSANFNYGIISNDNYERTIKRKANGSIDSVEFRSVRPR